MTLVVLVTLLAAPAAKQPDTKSATLAPKKEFLLDEALSAKQGDTLPEADTGPGLSADDLFAAQAQGFMNEKLDEEVALSEQLLELERGCTAAGPIKFRLADLYYEKSRRAFLLANDFQKDEAQRDQAGKDSGAFRQKSIGFFRDLVQSCPDFSERTRALYYLGMTLLEANEFEEASSYFREIISGSPDSEWVAQSWFMVGQYYFDQKGDPHKAMAAYEKAAAFEAAPVAGFGVYKQGWCHINLDAWKDALASFKKAVEIAQDPKRPLPAGMRKALLEEGTKDYVRSYAQVGDPKKASADFLRLAGEEKVTALLERLGEWYVRGGQHKQTLVVYDELLRKNQTSTRVPLYLGRIVDASSVAESRGATVDRVKGLTSSLLALREKYEGKDTPKDVQEDLAQAAVVAENTLRRLSLELHKDAKGLAGKSRKKTFEQALELYQYYLQLFLKPSDGSAINYPLYMRFYVAEVLYELENYSDAAFYYEEVLALEPDPKDAKLRELVLAAAEEAVRSRDLVAQKEDRRTPPPAVTATPVELPEIKRELIAACERYLAFKAGAIGTTANVRYKLARTYYTYGHFDEALPTLSALVAEHPKLDVGCYSAHLVLDIHHHRKAYTALRETARKLRADTTLGCAAEDRTLFLEIEEGAAFTEVQETLEKAGKYREAARGYEAFAKEFAKSKYADDAIYNSAISYEKAGDIESANGARKLFLRTFPQSEFATDVLYTMATSYERIADFGNAASFMIQFADRYPTDKRSRDMLYRAGVYLDELGQFEAARDARARFVEHYPRDPDAKSADFELCASWERQATRQKDAAKELWVKTAECFDGYAKARGRQADLVDQVCDATYRQLLARRELRAERETLALRTKILDAWKVWQKQKDSLPLCRRHVAKLRFQDLDGPYQRYTQMSIAELNPTDKGIKQFEKSRDAKVAERDRLLGLYSEIAGLGDADMALASLYRMGEVGMSAVAALLAVPIPDRIPGYELTAEDKATLRGQLSQGAAQVQVAAVEAFEVCVKKAQEIGLYSEWATKALRKLEELEPKRFPKFVEEVPKIEREAPPPQVFSLVLDA